MPRIPQIMIFLTPAGDIHAEVAGGNLRRKIDLPLGAEFAALRAELISQALEIRRVETLAATQRKTAADGKLEFQRAMQRKRTQVESEPEPRLVARSNFSAEELGL